MALPQAFVVALSCCVLVSSVACGSECRDRDGDGLGEGCERGSDCDDSDPKLGRYCSDAPASCDDNPTLEGCPCLASAGHACYSADPATLDVGVCRAGRADCSSGVFNACEGAVSPADETCNGLDDDCDGKLDEWVESPCGGCDTQCTGAVWGSPTEPFAAEGGATLTAAGELSLEQTTRSASLVWVPNTDEGTVSKLDAESARELARYRTPGGRPIQLAVDQRGDAWVLDGPVGERAMLTKIAALPERCRARAGGALDTSSGPTDLRSADDCVLLSVPVGEPGDEAEALAIDGAQAPDRELAGNAWVGFARSERLAVYDGEDGRLTREVALPGFAAVSGRFDVWGRLWLIGRDGRLAEVEPVLDPASVQLHEVELACWAIESLSILQDGPILFAAPSCESIARFDPERSRWSDAQVEGLLSPRALAAQSGEQFVVYTSGRLGGVDPSSLAAAEPFELASEDLAPFESHALAADGFGALWILSTQGGEGGRGLVTRYDPAAKAVSAQLTVGQGPRGGGDLTGLALGDPFVPEGRVSHVFSSGCAGRGSDRAGAGTRWKAVHLTARVGVGGEVEVQVRRAAEEAGLAEAIFATLGVFPEDASPYRLDLPDEGVVELQLILRARWATGAPRVARVGLEWECAGPE